jgi:hypothetical protein
MLEIFWKKHYVSGVTGSYHGDMAHTFTKILNDEDFQYYPKAYNQVVQSVRIHRHVESNFTFTERKWFCEKFPELPAYLPEVR